MLTDIIKIEQSKSLCEIHDSIRQGMPLAIFGVTDSFKNYLVSTIENQLVFVVRDIILANNILTAINEFTDKKAIILPPKDELLLINKGFSKDSEYQRIKALNEIEKADIIIATPQALMQSITVPTDSIYIKKDCEINRDEIIKNLSQIGYRRCDVVENKGEFSVRGDIVDVFPIDQDSPVKIDFFGDTVEDIKKYDIDSRKSLGYLQSINICQATETIFSKTDFDLIKTLMRNESCENNEVKARRNTIRDDVYIAMENYDYDSLSSFSCISENACYFDKLLKEDAVIVFDEAKRIEELITAYRKEFDERYNSLVKSGESFSFFDKSLLTVENFIDRIKKFRLCAMQTMLTAIPFFNPLKIVNLKITSIANYRLDFKEIFNDINGWLLNNYKIIICTDGQKRADELCIDLADRGITSVVNSTGDTRVNILTCRCDSGFIFHETKIVLIGSGNLYAKPVSTRKIKTKKQGFFTAPETGDYCVHEVHGIGRVLGSKKITTLEGTKDYIAIEYAGGDILYVPVESMDTITRYLGAEKSPKLSKIGGKDFEKIKSKVKASIKAMSFDLKKLYEERNKTVGFAFEEDSEIIDSFNSAFEFEDTPDQVTTTLDIKKDMASDKVMDRLICGDVGFGKTEMAYRAGFIAIMNGKQVAMLAPTTILTEQHYNTALKRFQEYGVRVACLNRFRSPKQQADIRKKMKSGDIDFVIGTHRLLGSDIGFKDLGLLILDEEQRFGVEHKEKIKLLKKNVDTLTLSATPIPRTLHMALSGIRQISTINTPPKQRLPVQTYVTEETDMLIRDVITREKARCGQAFILYNRVESIYTFASHIQAILPNIKLTVVHGQMDEKMMENNILDFYQGKSDVLISTTIIENGIDLPKANTLVVIDADRLGLSTLYQLKGRVGRSDRLAYAYFTFKRDKVLTDTAYERLNAIIEFAEMGSGIKIAMRDLEIRGAGNVLGAEQHGHMDRIGYELYSKLLKEELDGEEEVNLELDIHVTAFIPDNYIESKSNKMDMYKQIAEISCKKDVEEMRETLLENYGKLPIEVENLINITEIKYLSKPFKIEKIVISKENVYIAFSDIHVLADKRLQQALEEYKKFTKLVVEDKIKVDFVRQGDNNCMLGVIKDFLRTKEKM